MGAGPPPGCHPARGRPARHAPDRGLSVAPGGPARRLERADSLPLRRRAIARRARNRVTRRRLGLLAEPRGRRRAGPAARRIPAGQAARRRRVRSGPDRPRDGAAQPPGPGAPGPGARSPDDPHPRQPRLYRVRPRHRACQRCDRACRHAEYAGLRRRRDVRADLCHRARASHGPRGRREARRTRGRLAGRRRVARRLRRGHESQVRTDGSRGAARAGARGGAPRPPRSRPRLVALLRRHQGRRSGARRDPASLRRRRTDERRSDL